MASAQEKIETMVIRSVRLDLNEDEAQFLVDLLGRVGGDPELSRRKHERSIRDALEGVNTFRSANSDISGFINFDS